MVRQESNLRLEIEMTKLAVTAMTKNHIDSVVRYWFDASPSDLERMGVDSSKLPTIDVFRSKLESTLGLEPHSQKSFYLIWSVDDEAIGYSSLKDIEFGETGGMHLHMWNSSVRGQGYGGRLFCMSALEFYKRFELKTLRCEPSSANPMPNRMLQKIGFELEKTYVAASSDLSAVCELNRYLISKQKAENYLRSFA